MTIAEPDARATATGWGVVTDLLLVEDDDGDAFLVREMLADCDPPMRIAWARSVAEASLQLGPRISCVLLDLGLPDAEGLAALARVTELAPDTAVLVLTGLTDDASGTAAVAAGAQDYLNKGQVDPDRLARAIRYAIERKRADVSQRDLAESRLRQAENARLERGLLPQPLLRDLRLSVHARYRPGRQRALLGGDFYDVVETTDGTLLLLVGDVSGHGPDEAALGVSLRIAWRALVLGRVAAPALLPALDDLLVSERASEEVFATVAMVVVAPDRASAELYLAGHPAPLLLPASARHPGAPGQLGDDHVGPALGIVEGAIWEAAPVALPPGWTLLLFTDGVIEGRVRSSGGRLGVDGLLGLLDVCLRRGLGRFRLLDAVLDAAVAENAGELTDDVALVLVGSDSADG